MKLNYKSFGEGEAVIILHGLFGMLDNWQSFSKALSKEYQVFTLDQRNHGKSFRSQEFNYDLLSMDLKDFITEMGIGPCHVIGHSMGGKVAMKFVQKYPELTKSIVVIDIAAKAYPDSHKVIFDAVMSIPIQALAARKEAEEVLLEKLKDSTIVQFLLKGLERKTNGTFEWKTNFEALLANYDRIREAIIIERQIETSTLIVRGKRSKYVLDSDLYELKKYFKELKIVELDAGHWIHAEVPDELLIELEQFLGNV